MNRTQRIVKDKCSSLFVINIINKEKSFYSINTSCSYMLSFLMRYRAIFVCCKNAKCQFHFHFQATVMTTLQAHLVKSAFFTDFFIFSFVTLTCTYFYLFILFYLFYFWHLYQIFVNSCKTFHCKTPSATFLKKLPQTLICSSLSNSPLLIMLLISFSFNQAVIFLLYILVSLF